MTTNEEDKAKYKNVLVEIARPTEIIEIAQVHPSAPNRRQQYEEEEKIRKEKEEAFEKIKQEKQEQDNRVIESRHEDKMFSLYGITRTPRFGEILFSQDHSCLWCGSNNVAFIANRTPNYTHQCFDKSIPLEKSITDDFGNWVQRHLCVPPLKKNSELLCLQKRLLNAEILIRDLRNQLNKHATDDSRHRGLR